MLMMYHVSPLRFKAVEVWKVDDPFAQDASSNIWVSCMSI